MPIDHTCERCGNPFSGGPNQRRRYCSRACRWEPRPTIPQDDGTVLVPVGKSDFAIVDAEDADAAQRINWYLHNGRYAANGGHPILFMHRSIAECVDDLDTDHIDGNGLNNRRSNLRCVSHRHNIANARKRRDNQSGFRGVSWYEARQKWIAQVQKQHLGCFETPEEAACAYDVAARKIWGEFARLNFPLSEVANELP